jgi:hypothetical protein
MLVPAQAFVGQFLMTFKDYPQRQEASSFSMDEFFRSCRKVAGRSRTGGSHPRSKKCPGVSNPAGPPENVLEQHPTKFERG